MTGDDIFARIKNILEEWFEVEPEAISPEAHLRNDLELDSLDRVDLIVAAEKEFKVKVVRSEDEPKIRAMIKLSDVCDFIKDKLAKQGA